MADAEWDLSRVGSEFIKVGAALAEVDLTRVEAFDAKKVALETRKLVQDGFLLMSAKLDSISARLAEIVPPHQASHWMAPYAEYDQNAPSDATDYFHTFFHLTTVYILNPGTQPVSYEVRSRRKKGKVVGTHSGTIKPETAMRVKVDDDKLRMWLDLKASGPVLPAWYVITRNIYGRAPTDEFPHGQPPNPYQGDVGSFGFAIPWYPVG